MTAELAGQPIMVLRDRDGNLRAQSNVCLHRMSMLLEGAGHVKSIVCPYHGWTYTLDGKPAGRRRDEAERDLRSKEPTPAADPL